MRTMVFKSVVDNVIRMHGLNPKIMQEEDVAASLVMHINSRVEQALLAWDWPEWEVTEERSFRQVWRNDKQYLRVGLSGGPDEVFHLPTMLYWKVNVLATTDPPIGTEPGKPALQQFWNQETAVDAYVEY